jgi:hypothetical protein
MSFVGLRLLLGIVRRPPPTNRQPRTAVQQAYLGISAFEGSPVQAELDAESSLVGLGSDDQKMVGRKGRQAYFADSKLKDETISTYILPDVPPNTYKFAMMRRFCQDLQGNLQ